MKTKQIISGIQASKSLAECQEMMAGKVSQNKAAGKALYQTGIYTRGRSYNPTEGLPLHKDIYILTDDGIKTLCYNTAPHRADRALNLYKSNQLNDVDYAIWHNYITNGFNTRRGLLANYGGNTRDRINKIARSHADYLGNESSSSTDHINRTNMRN